MPHGDKSKYTDKPKRTAEHIEVSYEVLGVPENEAEARGLNKSAQKHKITEVMTCRVAWIQTQIIMREIAL